MLKSIVFPALIALYSFSVLCLLVAAFSTFTNPAERAEVEFGVLTAERSES